MEASLPVQKLVEEGQAAFNSGSFLAAAEAFEKAAREYAQNGNLLDQAEMANNQSVALLKAGDARQAYQVAAGTDQLFAEAQDPRRQAIALANQATALEALNQTGRAADLYQRSAKLFEQMGDKPMAAFVLQSLSAAELRRRHIWDALSAMQGALAFKQRLTLRDRLLRWLLKITFTLMQRQMG